MSGITGGSGLEIGGGEIQHPKHDQNYCINLVIKTNLASVDTSLLKEIKVGELLPVESQSVDGPVVVLKDKSILGAVLSSHLMDLVNCINNGTEYQAEILKIDEALCQVTIFAKK